MKYKTHITTFIMFAMILSLVGCGVPKTEHEKVVKELEKANEQKATLTDQLDKVVKEKESLSGQIADLQKQVSTLQKENEGLKVKRPSKGQAPKTSSKKK